jgi:predicted restriction endonuclease
MLTSTSTLIEDIEDIESATDISETAKKTLIEARLGQGRFRQKLMKAWGGRCAVTGCQVAEALRASHIVPWSESSNRDRLDPNNGLLLVANVDALFDRGLVSFDSDGGMVVSSTIPHADRQLLGVPARITAPLNPKLQKFLATHRQRFLTKHGI